MQLWGSDCGSAGHQGLPRLEHEPEGRALPGHDQFSVPRWSPPHPGRLSPGNIYRFQRLGHPFQFADRRLKPCITVAAGETFAPAVQDTLQVIPQGRDQLDGLVQLALPPAGGRTLSLRPRGRRITPGRPSGFRQALPDQVKGYRGSLRRPGAAAWPRPSGPRRPAPIASSGRASVVVASAAPLCLLVIWRFQGYY